MFVVSAEAANRTGSHRVGGSSSHGKGSHYSGGHFTEQVAPAKLMSYGMPSCQKYEMTRPLNCKEVLL